jgi:hypothetical protein
LCLRNGILARKWSQATRIRTDFSRLRPFFGVSFHTHGPDRAFSTGLASTRTIRLRRTQTPSMSLPVRGRMRLQDWERMSHGLYVPKTPPRSLVDDLRAWSLVVPSTAAFTHLTAAELNGWWLPDAPPHPVFAAMRRTDPRPRPSGLYVCRHPNPYPMRITADGLKITRWEELLDESMLRRPGRVRALRKWSRAL